VSEEDLQLQKVPRDQLLIRQILHNQVVQDRTTVTTGR